MRTLRSLLILALIPGATCQRERRVFDLASVPAKDLRKVAEEVRPAALPKGLTATVDSLPSPDGGRIAYSEQVAAGLESLVVELYVSDARGGRRVRIAEATNLSGMVWSPDGSKIAFAEGTLVHVVDSDGRSRRTVYAGPGGPYPGACFNLVWSEDGRTLSFLQLENAHDPELANPAEVTLTLSVARGE